MINLDEHNQRTYAVTLKDDRSEVTVEYCLSEMSDLLGRINQLPKGDSAGLITVVTEGLAKTIKWWDIYEREGVPLPVTRVDALPLSVVLWIWDGLAKDAFKRLNLLTSEVSDKT